MKCRIRCKCGAVQGWTLVLMNGIKDHNPATLMYRDVTGDFYICSDPAHRHLLGCRKCAGAVLTEGAWEAL